MASGISFWFMTKGNKWEFSMNVCSPHSHMNPEWFFEKEWPDADKMSHEDARKCIEEGVSEYYKFKRNRDVTGSLAARNYRGYM